MCEYVYLEFFLISNVICPTIKMDIDFLSMTNTININIIKITKLNIIYINKQYYPYFYI